jgi:hypothetical protein
MADGDGNYENKGNYGADGKMKAARFNFGTSRSGDRRSELQIWFGCSPSSRAEPRLGTTPQGEGEIVAAFLEIGANTLAVL